MSKNHYDSLGKQNQITLNLPRQKHIQIIHKDLHLRRPSSHAFIQLGSFRRKSSRYDSTRNEINCRSVRNLNQRSFETFISKKTQQDELSQQFNRLKLKCKGANQFLRAHQISHVYRARMVDWMLQVISSFNFKTRTLFKAVYLMDKYFQKRQQQLEIEQLHTIGVASLFISIKYEQINPLKMKHVHQKVAHKKISPAEIKCRQRQILQILEYQIANQPNIYQFVNVLIHCSSLFQIPGFQQLVLQIAKISLHSYDILAKLTQYEIALGSLELALRFHQLKNNDRIYVIKSNEICKSTYYQSYQLKQLGKSLQKLLIQVQWKNLKNLQKTGMTLKEDDLKIL